MSHYLEIWFRGEEAEHFRRDFAEAEDSYYPHITLVRPFQPKVAEEEIQRLIVGACEGKTPIAFSLEGKGAFGKVEFAPKLDDEKTLHLTVGVTKEIDSFPKTNYHMLRLTAIRDKKIWFSYDFATDEILSREESLDKNRWRQTVRGFYDMVSTV